MKSMDDKWSERFARLEAFFPGQEFSSTGGTGQEVGRGGD